MQLNYIVNEYSNTYHSTYINFGIKNNEKNPKFEVVDHVRISKFKNIFAIGYKPNCFYD